MYTVNSTLKDEMNIFLCILLLSKYLNVRSNLSLSIFLSVCKHLHMDGFTESLLVHMHWIIKKNVSYYHHSTHTQKKIIRLMGKQ